MYFHKLECFHYYLNYSFSSQCVTPFRESSIHAGHCEMVS